MEITQFQLKALLGAILSFTLFFFLINWLIKKTPWQKNTERTSQITTLCIVFSIGFLLQIGSAFSKMTVISGIDNIFLATSAIVYSILLYGLWHMKRWAGIGYVIIATINQIDWYITGTWQLVYLIVLTPVIVIANSWKQMK